MPPRQLKIVGKWSSHEWVRLSYYVISGCSTSIAIRGKDGVVFGVEKLITSKLYEIHSNKRIFTVDRHIGLVCWVMIISAF